MSALHSLSFRWLLVSGIATYLGTGVQMTAIAWMALNTTAGAFAVGLVLAARMVPNLLFGLTSGTMADRGDRNRLLIVVRLLALAPAIGLAWLAQSNNPDVWPLVILSFGTGCAQVFDQPARQALVIDTAPREVAPNAMALNATASRLCTALGALLAGALIPVAGVPACFVVAAVFFGLAAAFGLLIRAPRHAVLRGRREQTTFVQALLEAARLLVDLPEIRTLVVAAVACEVFGFSFQTAVPAFARDVLDAGAEGLGTLNAATSLGGAMAVVVLSLVPSRVPRQPLLGLVFVIYGASMLALAPSTTLAVASAALLVTGACAASFDVLQQTLMQLAVPEDQRGRAMGLWVLGIGSAPVGNLEMGALVASVGAPLALALNGGLVLLSAVLLLVTAPAYRTVAAATRPERS